jgi:hypothetical protein
MDRQFNLLIKAVGGDGEKGTIINTKFGYTFTEKLN